MDDHDEPDADGHDADGQLTAFLDHLGLPPRVAGQVHLHAAAAHAGTLDHLLGVMHDDPEEYEQMVDGLVPQVEADRGGDDGPLAEGDEEESEEDEDDEEDDEEDKQEEDDEDEEQEDDE